jgi:hypothetical protein
MLLFGTSLAVAKGCAFVMSLCSTALTFLAARWLGLALAPAFYGTLAATLLPHSLWLNLATVPEGYTAALCLLALASLKGKSRARRSWGAAAICAATLCRYESWPLAVAFAVATILDVRRGLFERSGLVIAGGAVTGMLAWLLHGLVDHGSAVFFLTRVAQYKQALGGSHGDGLLHFPLLLLRAEPELTLALTCSLAWLPSRRALLARYRRQIWLAALMLGFLMLGNLLDGAATHHAERSLLTIWLLGILIASDAWARLLTKSSPRRLVALAAFTGVCVLINLSRDGIVHREPFVDRRPELSIGLLAHRIVSRDPGKVAVHTMDFGYHAVIAALDLPGLGEAVQSHDPRLKEPPATGERLGALAADWLIADKASPLSYIPGALHAENASFVLINLNER